MRPGSSRGQAGARKVALESDFLGILLFGLSAGAESSLGVETRFP